MLEEPKILEDDCPIIEISESPNMSFNSSCARESETSFSESPVRELIPKL